MWSFITVAMVGNEYSCNFSMWHLAFPFLQWPDYSHVLLLNAQAEQWEANERLELCFSAHNTFLLLQQSFQSELEIWKVAVKLKQRIRQQEVLLHIFYTVVFGGAQGDFLYPSFRIQYQKSILFTFVNPIFILYLKPVFRLLMVHCHCI